MPAYGNLIDIDRLSLYHDKAKLYFAHATHRHAASDISSGTIAKERLSDAFTQAAGDNSTKIATTAFVTSAIASAIAGITGISFEVVQTLPATGDPGTIYLLAHSHGAQDAYDEFVYVNGSWEKIGHADVDLSGYVQTSDITLATDSQINALFTNAA